VDFVDFNRDTAVEKQKRCQVSGIRKILPVTAQIASDPAQMFPAFCTAEVPLLSWRVNRRGARTLDPNILKFRIGNLDRTEVVPIPLSTSSVKELLDDAGHMFPTVYCTHDDFGVPET